MIHPPSFIDPEEGKPLMYWAGLTLHACQQFEYGLKFLIVSLAGTRFGEIAMEEAVAIIEDQSKRTTGQILAMLNRKVSLSDGWSAALQAGLEARNEVIHRFFVDRAEQSVDAAGRTAMLADIKRLRRTVVAADRAVQEILDVLWAAHGIDMRRMAEDLYEELRAEGAAG